MKPKLTRRQFLAGTLAGSAALYSPGLLARGSRPASMTDRVTLGHTGIRPSYLGFGTGTRGWDKQSNQTRLGGAAFVRMIRHALEQGISYFDAADIYGTHYLLRSALRGVPREQVVLETKIWYRTSKGARQDLDRFRRELGTDYIDMVHIHAVSDAPWGPPIREAMDALAAAKEQGIIRAHGMSIHSLEALQAAAASPWVDMVLARINHRGQNMDGAPEVVVPVLQQLRAAGKGVSGIKILAEGALAGERQQSLRYVLGLDCVQAMLIGFESTEQVDDILRLGNALLAGR